MSRLSMAWVGSCSIVGLYIVVPKDSGLRRLQCAVRKLGRLKCRPRMQPWTWNLQKANKGQSCQLVSHVLSLLTCRLACQIDLKVLGYHLLTDWIDTCRPIAFFIKTSSSCKSTAEVLPVSRYRSPRKSATTEVMSSSETLFRNSLHIEIESLRYKVSPY